MLFTRSTSRRLVLAAACLIAFGGGASSSADTIKDRFSDGTPDPLWRVDRDSIDISEFDGKLRFRSDSGSGERLSAYESDDWQFRADQSYKIEMKYRLTPDSVGSGEWAAVGLKADESGQGNEFFVFVRRDSSGLEIVVLRDFGGDDDGSEVSRPISAASGTMTVRYSARKNRLKVFIDGDRVLSIRRFLRNPSQTFPAELLIGASRKGSVRWGFSDVWIDNFLIKGRIEQ